MDMIKRKHDKNHRLEYEGKAWNVNIAEWWDANAQKGELRVYRIEGDVTSPLLNDALVLEAQARGLSLSGTRRLNH